MSPRWFDLEPKFWKLWPCLFFVTDHNFANRPHFVALTRLRPTITGSNICCTHLSYTFSEFWVRKDSEDTCPEKFSRWKFSGTERVNKNSLLYQFPCTDGKKSIKAVCAKCYWCYRISTYPSWTVGSQTFSGFHWSLPDVNSLGSRAFQC